MLTRREVNAGLLAGAFAAVPHFAAADEQKTIFLPAPRTDGGVSLRAALQKRQSIREFADRPLPLPLLSDLLWAAYGINRPASGDRTAPCWRHVQVIDIYVAMADGVWLFEPKANALLLHVAKDLREETGMQDFVKTAPVNLVYVAHGERMGNIAEQERILWASVDSGFIGQNVYLLAAAEGLATVFRASVEHAQLAASLGLPSQQFITAAQSVGYPRS
ncbi:nitroreductase family protein [Telmatospirillum sp.]|uniref:nitroreductase family protein n=1 Tax=Telmatospirillum sp. TaxID=2079197 RepID=UPI00283B3F1E|nr:nitroreductase family protein [Telmatospirillum sp.]MDR3437567.1 nitroreductase family protein [Telmatospirillum sp.]